MTASPDAICCCIDLDGFFVQNRFLVRELGWCRADLTQVGTYHYTHSIPYCTLTPKEKQTVAYVRKHLLGMAFRPNKHERACGVFPQRDVPDHIVSIWERCQTPEARTIAFKGGQYEKHYLRALDIPFINLETYGCPKFDTICSHPFTCGWHQPGPQTCHCSRSECYTFMQWYKQYQTNKAS